MRISIDVDGVLLDYFRVLLSKINKKHGLDCKYEDADSWVWFKRYGLTEKQFFDVVHIEDYSLAQPIEKGAHKYMEKLNKLYDCDIVTVKPYPELWRDIVIDKLKELGLHRWTHYNGLEIIRPEIGKELLNYDIYIDDSPILAKKLIGTRKEMLLYNQPWNWLFPCEEYSSNMTRVRNWKDIYRLLKYKDI